MFLPTVADPCGVCQCTSLFKHAFKIKSTPEESVRPRPKARRLLGMASQRLSSPSLLAVPNTDKENGPVNRSPYTSSPQKIVVMKDSRYPLEDCDPNSQDSGYGASFPDRDGKVSRNGFRFAEPLAVAPRRMSLEHRSPMASPVRPSPLKPRAARSLLFRSLSSGYESMDDGFTELLDIENVVEGTTTQLPNGITSLLSGNIVDADSIPLPLEETCITTTPEFTKRKSAKTMRRSLSFQSASRPSGQQLSKSAGGGLSKVRSCLFRSPNATSSTAELSFEENLTRIPDPFRLEQPVTVRTFKRPEPPIEESPKLVKRCRRSNSFLDTIEILPSPKPILQRSFSETDTHAHIKSAVHRSTMDADLTGDFSKPCVLPLAEGHHEDLKSISPDTLASLIRGEFNDRIGSFQIVDCRYPYEFDGGHIQGAVNIYSKDLIERVLLDPLTGTPVIQPDTDKRNILVFHCEFSWERGPNLSRCLRKLDRQRNKDHYPALHYPEVYLLHGGYEQFFKQQRNLCSPQGYRPMRHPDHETDLKQFRSKSKSWQGEKPRINSLTTKSSSLKRLGF